MESAGGKEGVMSTTGTLGSPYAFLFSMKSVFSMMVSLIYQLLLSKTSYCNSKLLCNRSLARFLSCFSHKTRVGGHGRVGSVHAVVIVMEVGVDTKNEGV